MKYAFKYGCIFGIASCILFFQSGIASAALTNSEETLIRTYIQNRSTQYTQPTLTSKATRIQNRITSALTTTVFNEFTTDILVFIDGQLNQYIQAPLSTPTSSTPQSPVITTPPSTTTNQPVGPMVPESNTQINQSIASQIQSFDNEEEIVLVAGSQGVVVAEFELNARLEDFILEEVSLDSGSTDIDQSIAQLHLYTQDGVKLGSDRPNSQGVFEFRTLDTVLPQGSTMLYAVIDTMIVGYNGQSQEDLVDFTLRISDGEAKGATSSSTYRVGNGNLSAPITIQSVLIQEVEFVTQGAGARVNTTLTNGTNTLTILKVTTAESNSNEFNSPRDLDVLLNTLTVQVSDNTMNQSAKNSLILTRIDENGNDISGTITGTDDVTFTFDPTDSSRVIDNGSDAYFRIEATNVQLTPNQGESVRIELDQAKHAITYRSSDERSSIFSKNNTPLFVISNNQISD